MDCSKNLYISQSMTNLNKPRLSSSRSGYNLSTETHFKKSRSLADITKLIIHEDLNNNNVLSYENKLDWSENLPNFLKQNCSIFEKSELFPQIIRIIDMYRSAQVSAQIIISFEPLATCFLTSSQNKTSARYFCAFIQAILHHIIHVEDLFPACCFFGVNLKSISSTLKTGKCTYLNEICLILLKVSGGDKKLCKEKFKLLENINEENSKLEGELLKSTELHCLSTESKIDLSLKLLGILDQKCPEMSEHFQIGSVNLVNFWRFKSSFDYLFIEIGGEWLYCNRLMSMKKICSYLAENMSTCASLLYENVKKLMNDIEINSTDADQTTENADICNITEDNSKSIIFSRDSSLSGCVNLSFSSTVQSSMSFITEKDIKRFDDEHLGNALEENNLELTFLKLIRQLLVSNFSQREIVVGIDNSISSYKIDPIFESLELRALLDYVCTSLQEKDEAQNDTKEMETIFGSLGWQNLRQSLQIDRTFNELFDLTIRLDGLKTLMKNIFNMVSTSNLKRNFVLAQRRSWLSCVASARTKNMLKIMLFILIENIKWQGNLTFIKCRICQENLEIGQSLVEALRWPDKLVKEKCQHCEMVFHLTCYAHAKYPLFESKKIQKNFSEKNYMCYKCNFDPKVMIPSGCFQQNVVCINNRVLRNTESRKKSTQVKENKPRPGRVLKRKIEYVCLPESTDDDSIPLTQISKRC